MTLHTNSSLLARPRVLARRIVKAIRGFQHRRAGASVARQLRQSPVPEVRIAGQMLSAMTNGKDSDLERRAVREIEVHRRDLCRQTRPLSSVSDEPLKDYDHVTVAEACGASKPLSSCYMLMRTVRSLGATSILELGTNVGISSAYLAIAAQAAGEAQIVTLEGSAHRQSIAQKLHADLRLEVVHVRGWFDDTLKSTCDRYGPFDLAFIDGNHQYDPTLRYFDLISAYMKKAGVVVFDDIRWSEGMRSAWAEVSRDRRVAAALDMDTVGLCVLKETERFDEPVIVGPLRGIM